VLCYSRVIEIAKWPIANDTARVAFQCDGDSLKKDRLGSKTCAPGLQFHIRGDFDHTCAAPGLRTPVFYTLAMLTT
jgi:hypothetical protein